MFDECEPEEREITPQLAAVERQLARLTPAAPRIDRDRLMFKAGQASVARPERPGYLAEPSRLGRYVWPSATAMMTAASLLLAVMLFDNRHALQMSQRTAPNIVPAHSANQPPAQGPLIERSAPANSILFTARTPESGYLAMRHIALTRGVGAIETWPESTGGSSNSPTQQSPTRREMLNDLLPSTREMNPKS